ncbi:MAG: DUF4412 domain-containing protein [Candidatus Binatus sp.]|uniref:DUF4412 domain-containing protein n=1 Tax=Candidatus Binatus sp. TaxID=2811406 RepID=UPI003BAE5407
MRKLTALVAGMTLAMTALPAAAGVVITQKQHVTSGTNTRDSEQTISVQGNKQKMVTERHTIITDLDAGKMYVLDPNAKTYFEIPFPPKGQMATMMAASTNAAMNFKRAGSSREIAGYKCTDYNGGGHMMAGDYTVKECFSTSAPGAQEFAAFEKNMADKLKNAGTAAGTGEIPGGVPLALDSTMKMGKVNIPGMAPDQAAKINEMMAKRPPVTTSTMVEKIETKKLAESDFALPSGFTKRELPGPGSMMMKPGAMKPPPPAGAPSPAAH